MEGVRSLLSFLSAMQNARAAMQNLAGKVPSGGGGGGGMMGLIGLGGIGYAGNNECLHHDTLPARA